MEKDLAKRQKNRQALLEEAEKELTLKPTLYTDDAPKKKGDKPAYARLYHSA